MRILNILKFIFSLLWRYKTIADITQPDVVIASSTYQLDIYPARLIARRKKAKLVFELHDLWPLSPMIIGKYSKFNPFIMLIQMAENHACKNSDCYISMLGNTKDYLVEHGLDPNKFYHIPNGFFADEIKEVNHSLPRAHKDLISRVKDSSNLVVGYVGGHAPSNALVNYMLAIKLLPKSLNISFVLVGDGPQKTDIVRIAEKYHLHNVFFLPPVPKSAIPELLNMFDVLYAGGISSPLHHYGTSFNKITDYMLSGKPIIFAVDDPNSIVERVGCGIQIPAENPGEFNIAMNQLASLSVSDKMALGERGREYAVKNLEYSKLAEKFLDAALHS
jgi:glycosyltransferase involved in cell wall biosynthesis